MKIVNVIPLKRGILKNDLSYFTTKDVVGGDIVSINLRSKKVLGLAVCTEEVSSAKINIKDMNFNLKKIIEVKGRSIFLKEYIESIVATSQYFVSTKSNAIASLLPTFFIEKYDEISTFTNAEAMPDKSGLLSIENIKAEKLLLQEEFENRISIYKTLIRENFARNKSIFIVLPTENDINIFTENLSKGIDQFIFTFHGGVSVKKNLDNLKAVLATEHPVLIIGTPPFLAIPKSNIGVVVLEHESSTAYRMIARPHFDMRTFVEIFASKINARFIMADNFLRFETIARREINGLIPMHPISFRINFKGEIEIENKKSKPKTSEDDQNKAPVFQILSNKILKEIELTVNKRKTSIHKSISGVFVYTLRRGLATQTICRDCGDTVNCEKCLAPLVLYSSKKDQSNFFVCNKCGEEKPGEAKCTHCQSWNLMPLGIATETVFEELSRVLPKNKIFRADKESVKTKKELEKIIGQFESDPTSILVGTEMVIPYIKNKVDTSIIASFDSFWSIPNFKMSEKIIQLVFSIVSKTENKLIIQTKNASDPIITAILSKNLLPFVRSELKDREKLSYPPFKRFIKIKYTGDKNDTITIKEFLEKNLSEYNPLIFSGFNAKLKGKYITNTLIKIDTVSWSLPELISYSTIDSKLLTKLQALPPEFEIYVDPEDLL